MMKGRVPRGLSSGGKGSDVVDIALGPLTEDGRGMGNPGSVRAGDGDARCGMEGGDALEARDPRGEDAQEEIEKKCRLAKPMSEDMTVNWGRYRDGGGRLKGGVSLVELCGEVPSRSNPLHGRRKRDEGLVEGFSRKKGRCEGGDQKWEDEVAGVGKGVLNGEMDQDEEQLEGRRKGAQDSKGQGRLSMPGRQGDEGGGVTGDDLVGGAQSGVVVNPNTQGDSFGERVLDLDRDGLEQRMKKCCRILEEGCRFVEAGPVETGGGSVLVHTIADRGCMRCNGEARHAGVFVLF